jgi:hypothetical protein
MVEKTIELTGTSSNGIEDAVALAISRAAVTITDIRQAQVTDVVAHVEDGRIVHWKVRLRVTFKVADRVHE